MDDLPIALGGPQCPHFFGMELTFTRSMGIVMLLPRSCCR